MGGKKPAKQFFQKHKNSARKKCWEKIVGKKCEKRFFIFTRKSWTKNGGKKLAKQFFQEHTNSSRKKFWGINRRKDGRKFFFIYTRISLPKNEGGKNARNNFSRNTRIVCAKMLGKKSSEKSGITFFYIHTNIVIKK